MEKKIGIASDHAGYEMKEFLVGYLAAKGWDVLDFGPESEESVDYPDFAHPLANAIESGELERSKSFRHAGSLPHLSRSHVHVHRFQLLILSSSVAPYSVIKHYLSFPAIL